MKEATDQSLSEGWGWKVAEPGAWSFPSICVLSAAGAVFALTLTAPPARAQDGSNGASVLDRVSSAPIAALAERVLVDGDPPLTEAMVDRFARFVSYIYEFPLTPADRDRFRAILVGEWRRGDQKGMAQDLETLKTEAEFARYGPNERDLVRQKMLPDLVKDGRAKAASDPDMRWLMGRYDAAHRDLVPGDPPLTRSITDASAEAICFMAGEGRGQQIAATKEFKEAAARLLMDRYGDLPADQRQALAQMPLLWATLRSAWPRMPEEQKAPLREQWRQQFGASAVAAAQAQTEAGGYTQAAPTPQAVAQPNAHSGDNDFVPVPTTQELLEKAAHEEQMAAETRAKGDPKMAGVARLEEQAAKRLRALATMPVEQRPRFTRGQLRAMAWNKVPTEYTNVYWTMKMQADPAYQAVQEMGRRQSVHFGLLNVMSTMAYGNHQVVRAMSGY